MFATLADQVFDRRHLDAELAQCQRLEPDVRLVEHEGGDHRVIVQTAQVDAVPTQHFHVELGVVQQLGDERVLQHRAQGGLDQLVVELRFVAAMPDRDVTALAFFIGERVAGDFAIDGVGG